MNNTKPSKIKKIVAGAGSFVGGIINGLLGAGGGMLMVPVLRFLNLDTKKAHANSIAIILPLCILSASIYLFQGRVELNDVWIYLPGGIAGAILGALLMKKIPDIWIRRVFGAFLIWAGIRILMS